MIDNFTHRKRIVIVEFLALIALPLIIFQIFPQLLIMRTAIMGLGIIYIIILSRHYKFDRYSFGIKQLGRTKPLKELVPILIFASITLYFIAALKQSILLLPAIQNSSLKLSLIMSIILFCTVSSPYHYRN